MKSLSWKAAFVFLASAASLFAYPSLHKMPVVDDQVMRCDQGYNDCSPTHCSYSTLGYAWDFNLNGTTGDADLGYPVVACADGRVVYAQNFNPQGYDDWGNCVVIDYDNDAANHQGLYAHLEQIFVKVGENVKSGQVIGTIGKGDGNYLAHLHYQVQSGSTPNAQSVSASFTDAGVPTAGNTYTSQNSRTIDLEQDAQGGSIGSKNGAVSWWYGWDAGNRYDGSNCARRCYKQAYTGGTYGSCAIVYDGLGGARKAYTVRTGFWNNGQGNGWSQLSPAGPQSSLGMPITNEYANGSGARQDFQKGYLYWNGSSVSVNYYPNGAPGWTSSGWNNQYSYLFARAYERNGARNTLGEATGNVYSYGTFLRQDFSGGSFGNCCILYDPQNATGNLAATNEAYLLRSEFYAHYNAVVGYQAYGCPSRDEYTTGDGTNAIQFFVRRGGAADDPFHYMYYDPTPPPGNDVIEWYSTYATQWVSQTPPGSFAMERDSTRVFTVQFRNTGTTTWYNNAGSYPYDYVVLKSCDPNGNAATSLLYASGLGWLDTQTPCTMQESSVAPGNVATFTFTGKVASNQAYGLMNIYFRPSHSMAGLLDGWGGMHYPITVIDATSFAGLTLTPIAGDWNQDGSFEVGVYADETRYFYLDTNNDGYTDLEIAYSAAIDEPLAGNWDNSGGYTVGFYRPPDRVFWLDYDNNGEMDVSLTFGNSGDLPLAGDWQGTGYTRIGLYRPSTRTFWLDFNNDGVADASATFGDAGDIPLSGDWDGDVDWTIGLYRPSTRTFWLDNNNDGAADFSRTFGDAGDLPIVGDWTGNGGTNIGVFRTSNKYFWLDFDSDGYPDRGFQLRRTVPGTPKVTTPDEGTTLPLAFTLNQNYPNPFNPTTTISYALPDATHVTLEVFNLLGQRVATLVNENQAAGEHQATWDASPYASGVYFYRIQTGEATETKKMLLLK